MTPVDRSTRKADTKAKQPNIELLRLEFEKEKWKADLAARERDFVLREREQVNRNEDVELKRNEQASSKWRSPLVVAILAAAIAGVGNAGVAALNGWLQRNLDSGKQSAERTLEENKAESTRILEMIKTGNTETAANNLAFLLDTGLIAEPGRADKLRKYLANRPVGTGPVLSAPTRFGFEPAAALTSSVQSELQRSLEKYIGYLDGLGFPAPDKKVIIGIDREIRSNVYYIPSTSELKIGEDVLMDTSAALNQYGHHILIGVQPTVGASAPDEVSAIEAGLADYFAASFLQNPKVGEAMSKVIGYSQPYLRTMDNERSFTDAKPAQSIENGEIWGGLFWELRQRFTREKFDSILAKAWRTVAFPKTGSDAPAVFVQVILDRIREAEPTWLTDAQNILRKRKFPVK